MKMKKIINNLKIINTSKILSSKFKNYHNFKENTANIYIYGDILDDEYCENSPNSVLYQLLNISGLEIINLYINSDGGSVSAGICICNIINRKRKEGVKCNVYIDGFACSIASVIALYTADTLHMYTNSLIMIHLPLIEHVDGNKYALMDTIKDLEKVEEQLVNVYMSVAKEEVEENTIKEMLKNETWLNKNDIERLFNVNIITKDCLNKDTLLEVDKYSCIYNLCEEKITDIKKAVVLEEAKKTLINIEINNINKYLK